MASDELQMSDTILNYSFMSETETETLRDKLKNYVHNSDDTMSTLNQEEGRH